MNDYEFRDYLKIEATELDMWIRQGWLVPRTSNDQRSFQDVDLARALLIMDLTRGMGVNEAGVDIVMDLIDQLHSLRGTLRDIMTVVTREDSAVQQRLIAALHKFHADH